MRALPVKHILILSNQPKQAEAWLKEQAQAMGWSKATKLEGRTTKQGLVGVLVDRNIGAMVEVNCETDFVARNETFQEFVQNVTKACAQHVADMPTNDSLSKVYIHLLKYLIYRIIFITFTFQIEFDADSLKNIQLGDGKPLSDHLALIIGKVGENASLRRATCFKATNSVSLAAFAHPAGKADAATENIVQLGKFGALVALHDATGNVDAQRNLCQHIVGMNPSKIGVPDVDKPAEIKDDEQCLLFQEYLLEPSMSVAEVLAESQIEVVQFKRFECGETLSTEKLAEKVPVEAAAASN